MARSRTHGRSLVCPLCLDYTNTLLQSQHGTLCGQCFEVVDQMYKHISFRYCWWLDTRSV